MPELPEVHHFQQYFNRHAVGRKIREVTVLDAKILRNATAEAFAQYLEGRTPTGTYRHGKYLFAHLLQLFQGHRTTLKALLLDQKAVAGIGNLYADEICYQTGVHPASKVAAIPPDRQKALYAAMRDILLEACTREIYYTDDAGERFWAWRTEGAPGPNGKGVIRRATLAGRTTYWWDKQALYEG